MNALQSELRRLGRAQARARGGRRAARVHLLVLLGALVLACLHRIVSPMPGFTWLDANWIRPLLGAIALLALGPLLASALGRLARPRPLTLARRLDERFRWRDETSTAVGLQANAASQPVPALLVAQTAGRLRVLGAKAMGIAGRPRRWPRLVLAFLFAFVLLAPGVKGLFGSVGAGPSVEPGGGREKALEPVGPPRPMRADFWLQSFVQNPIPVEPLSPEVPVKDEGAPR